MLPTAAIVSQVVAVVLLIGIAVGLVRAYRERGTSSTPVGTLEQVQGAAVVLAVVGLALSTFVDADVVDAVWVVGVFGTAALALVRWRRGERPLPRWM